MTDRLRELFPALRDFSVTSPREAHYNCIAWAAGEDNRWWSPDLDSYWPPEAPIDYGLGAYVSAFGTLGYQRCADGSLEEGFEKVAIYESLSGYVVHMSRQLRTGRWTSKLGGLEDIEHASPTELEGREYGKVVQYMRRVANPSSD